MAENLTNLAENLFKNWTPRTVWSSFFPSLLPPPGPPPPLFTQIFEFIIFLPDVPDWLGYEYAYKRLILFTALLPNISQMHILKDVACIIILLFVLTCQIL